MTGECFYLFQGIAIGNGLIDPRNMMNYSQLCAALGLLDDKEIDTLREIEQDAVRLTDAGKMVDAANVSITAQPLLIITSY